jgi:hypothetical protein
VKSADPTLAAFPPLIVSKILILRVGVKRTRPIRPLARSSASSEERAEERRGVRIISYHHFVQSIATTFELVPGIIVGGGDGPALGEVLGVVDEGGVEVFMHVLIMGKTYGAM